MWRRKMGRRSRRRSSFVPLAFTSTGSATRPRRSVSTRRSWSSILTDDVAMSGTRRSASRARQIRRDRGDAPHAQRQRSRPAKSARVVSPRSEASTRRSSTIPSKRSSRTRRRCASSRRVTSSARASRSSRAHARNVGTRPSRRSPKRFKLARSHPRIKPRCSVMRAVGTRRSSVAPTSR